MSARQRKFLRWLSLLAALFAFGLVMFGAFVRLSNAGLSCPDCPTCYGQITWPQHAQAVAHADAAFPDRPYEAHKAWREQVHRFLAGTLGVMVLVPVTIPNMLYTFFRYQLRRFWKTRRKRQSPGSGPTKRD